MPVPAAEAGARGSEPMTLILGSPRSGTTLLRLALACHPQMVVPPEAGFAVWLAERFAERIDSGENDAVAPFVDAVVSSRKFEHWRMDRSRVLAAVSDTFGGGYAAVIRAIYREYASLTGKPWAGLGDKNNFHITQLHWLDRVYPGAKIIHLVRDPRDVYCSRREVAALPAGVYSPAFGESAAAFADQWVAENLGVHLRFGLQGRYHRVEYADLVSDPRSSLQGICRHLELPYDEVMLDYPRINRTAALEPAELLPWKQRTLEDPDVSRVGRYRADLGERDARMIWERCRPFFTETRSRFDGGFGGVLDGSEAG